MANYLDIIVPDVKAKGDKAIKDTLSYASMAVDEAKNIFVQSWGVPTVNTVFKDPNLSNKDPTNIDLRDGYLSTYENELNSLRDKFPTQIKSFLAEYFPTAPNQLEIMKYLSDMVNNGGIGLPKEIEDQIWNQARDRENIELARLEAEVYNETSSRGFSIPPGSTSARVLNATNTSSMNTSKIISDIAIKQAEMRIDFIKFAIDQLLKSRIQAIESALKYLSEYNGLDKVALAKAGGYVESYKSFYQSMNAYVTSINDLNRLNLEKDKTNASLGMENIKTFLSNNDSIRKWRTTTLVQAASAVSGLSAAAVSAMQVVGNSSSLSTN